MDQPLTKSSLLVSPVADGYAVYDIDEKRFHELNPTAALLFELCDGERSIDEITTIAKGVLPEDSEGAVVGWIEQAEKAGILIEGKDFDRGAARQLTSVDLVELASELREGGLVQAACMCQDQAVALETDNAAYLRELGELAHILGKRPEARAAYERYLDLMEEDAEIRHLLTSLRDEQAPARVPDECVQQLYERFASFYESNMCGELGYEGPEQLCTVIDESLGERNDLNVLDLGCGTGLAGLAIKRRAGRLVGVDLSPAMIEHARERKIYDELHVAEVTDWLRNTDEKFDLIIACDTFIYFGDLGPVLALAAERLAEGGRIAFSVERAENGSHQLTDNGRYLHHQSHLTEAAHAADLKVCNHRQAFLRMEYGEPVNGTYMCLSGPPVDSALN